MASGLRSLRRLVFAPGAYWHPQWGPRKVRAWLEQRGAGPCPAPSTIGALLQRAGLTGPRRRRARRGETGPPVLVAGANDVWAADFKGWFRTGDGRRCDPLTISDLHSRYLLRCQVVGAAQTELVQPIFAAAFREYGLPRVLRTDNGAPFAGAGGVSRLAVWWIRLGVRPERIAPGHPEQNAVHERMHRTLKEATAMPPQATLAAQQRAFDRFRRVYNEERPHEALSQRPRATVYTASPHPYPGLTLRAGALLLDFNRAAADRRDSNQCNPSPRSLRHAAPDRLASDPSSTRIGAR